MNKLKHFLLVEEIIAMLSLLILLYLRNYIIGYYKPNWKSGEFIYCINTLDNTIIFTDNSDFQTHLLAFPTNECREKFVNLNGVSYLLNKAKILL